MELSGAEWAQRVFGNANLGDARLTKRAISVLGYLADGAGLSIPEMGHGDSSVTQRIYRHARCAGINPVDLIDEGCSQMAEACQNVTGDILLLGDTTSIGYGHHLRTQLGDMGGVENSRRRGWYVHSVLAVEASRKRRVLNGRQVPSVPMSGSWITANDWSL